MYRERRTQPLWLLMLALLMTISLGIAYSAATSTMIGSLIGVALSFPAVWFWWRASSNIEVTPTHLLVGRLRLERECIGRVEVLNSEEFLHRIRVGSKTTDALLFTRTNTGGVVLEILDDTDPYRAWVVSSARPAELGAALRERVAI